MMEVTLPQPMLSHGTPPSSDATLRNSARETQKTPENIQSDISILHKDVSQSDVKIEKLKETLQLRDSEIARLESELDRAKAEIDERFAEIACLSDALLEQDTELELLKTRVGGLALLDGDTAAMPRIFADKAALATQMTQMIETLLDLQNIFGDDALLHDMERKTELIARTGLVDRDWYLTEYPDVRKAGMDPVAHFVYHGFKENRSPSAVFARHQDDKKK